MKLPNGENAQLGDKVERYCLNLAHSRGRNKAILFRSRLGITLDNKEILEIALLEAAVTLDQFVVVWRSATKSDVSISEQVAAIVEQLPDDRRKQVFEFARSLVLKEHFVQSETSVVRAILGIR
ncbi:hypothetical protein NC981_05940 [Leptolyngbya sp. DQ-M1]|uniref:DUF6883 domain-containing protein n=1 Tax=Leptolyngbya sp. DQ-M1 TaxID=2933920 RepID=UPI0032969FE3